ncbi:MAG: glycosyltransferase family 87 protein [Alphaproteobacteria bacterium]
MKPMWTDKFSKADWIDKERVTNYPRMLVVMYVIAIILVLATSRDMIDFSGKNIGTDFMDVWSAGKMALEKQPAEVYDYQKHMDVQKAALPWPLVKDGKPFQVPFYGWHYPPVFLMVAAALAFFPYGLSLLVWVAVTLPAYLAAIRAILPRREALMAALAFPGVFVTLGHGQNGFLTAGLFGGALVLLEKRPYVAGVLFGLMCYKPQLGVLIPLALLCCGCWRAIFSAGLTVVLASALSCILFGVETWQAFIDSFGLTRTVVLEAGSTGWEKIQSIFSAVRLLGGGVELAYAAQGIFALVAAGAVIWVWRSKAGMELKSAALVTASLMVTPYVLDYDLVLLALPVAWIAALGLRSGFLPWEKITLFSVFVLPLLSRMLGQYLHIPVAPLVMVGLLWVVVRRVNIKAARAL